MNNNNRFIDDKGLSESTSLTHLLKSWRSENHTPHYYWLNQSK